MAVPKSFDFCRSFRPLSSEFLKWLTYVFDVYIRCDTVDRVINISLVVDPSLRQDKISKFIDELVDREDKDLVSSFLGKIRLFYLKFQPDWKFGISYNLTGCSE